MHDFWRHVREWLWPPAPLPAPAPPPLPVVEVAVDIDCKNIRRLAISMVTKRPDQQLTVLLSDVRVMWLKSLDRRQLCIVVFASDADLRGHCRGTSHIRGVRAGDRESVLAYSEFQKEQERRRRRLKDEGDGRRGSGGGPKRSVNVDAFRELQEAFEMQTFEQRGPR
jgi:hypothetical protein